MTKPNEITLKKSKQSLLIKFEDGKSFEFSSELLRVESPSAEVRGHSFSQKKTVPNKKNVKIQSIEQIGNYAIAINFDDGHNTGIFSWDFLYNLMENKDQVWHNYLRKLKEEKLTR